MAEKRESLADFRNRFFTILENGSKVRQNLERLALLGYDEAKFAEGYGLYDSLIKLDAEQVREYEEQNTATTAVNQAWDTVDVTYGLHRALGNRILAKTPTVKKKLLLHEPKPRTRAACLRQSDIFYTNLIPDTNLVAEMTKFGQTLAILQATHAAVRHVAELDAAQQEETAQAQEATQARDAAWREAQIWLATLIEVSAYAFADAPQLREAFLTVVKS